MVTRVIAAIGVLVSLGAYVSAQNSDALSALSGSSAHTPSLALSDARHFPFSHSSAWLEATPSDFLPNWRPEGWDNGSDLSFADALPQRRSKQAGAASRSYSEDSSKEVVELRKSLWENVHGEVGFLYGRSAGGRFQRDVESGYIFGTVGDEKTSISVGASYENSNYNFSRRGR
jgi:hypothetical protein